MSEKKRITIIDGKMSKSDLITARIATRDLAVQTGREFIASILLLTCAIVLSGLFVPETLDKVVGISALLIGLVFGMMIGAARAQLIFWQKMEFRENDEEKDRDSQ